MPKSTPLALHSTNGIMVMRVVCEQIHNYGYDAENHLTAVSGAAQANFTYNGDGQRVVAVEGTTKTIFVGNYFEWKVNTSQASKYYFAGSTRVAMQRGTEGVKYLLGDHLGSASVALNADGTALGSQGYLPWGEVNFTEGSIDMEYTFTGQYSYDNFGLAYFNARWYDSSIGRFAQSDTIIPEASQGTQAWDRYAYVNNNAIRYVDPAGHCTGDPDDPKNPDYACWLKLDEIQNTYTNVKIDSKFSLEELKLIQLAIEMVAYVFGGPEVFIKLMGDFKISRLPIIGDTGTGKGNINLGKVFYNANRALSVLVHEMGHIFDMKSGDPKSYHSQIFNQQFNQTQCSNPGSLGCLGNQPLSWVYAGFSLNMPGNYDPQNASNDYQKVSSTEDFAVTFTAFVFLQNGWAAPMNVDSLRLDFMKGIIEIAILNAK
jgi:RHS repeat-associated protein